MPEINKLKFTSFSDFLKKTGALFKGPAFVTTFFNLDGAFREKLIITVSIANACGG
ncbi:MAG: DUF4406 domain-containing protein [Spirochaetes bacterium]|nr:DUF4406 domain-containing protein [Spirochaetota bacterium]